MKLLAIDMDKTCLNDKNLISDKTIDVLKKAHDEGIIIVPTTGRSLSCLPHQLKNETFYDYVISSNGAVVSNVRTKEEIYEAKIDKNNAISLLQACTNLKIGLSVHVNHEFILQGKFLGLMGYLSYGKDTANTIVVKNLVSYLEGNDYDVEEIQLFFNKKNEKDLVIELSKYDYFYKAYTDHYVEIYDLKASKGRALLALAHYLNIKPEDIISIGDAENDLSMFEVSGLKLAMGNGIDELKDKADYVLPSNNEDGVWYGVNHYVRKIKE